MAPPIAKSVECRELVIHNQKDESSYKVINIIGYGGFGAVYEAENTSTKEHVALKQTFDPKHIRAFQKEFEVLSKLKHPHLPHYSETFEALGNGYLVMELIPGNSLQEILEMQECLEESSYGKKYRPLHEPVSKTLL